MPNRVLLHGAADSRAIDARAIVELDTPGFELMQRAAQFAFDRMLAHWSGIKRITVLCGKGNNAGDAYLVAKLAKQVGLAVQVLALVPPNTLKGDALTAFEAAVAAGISVDATTASISGDVVIDGLLGTGIRGQVEGALAAAIASINQAKRPVLSIDVPSGVMCDSGAIAGTAVNASVTCMFITRKVGLYTGAGVSFAGLREYSDLGVPASFLDTAGALPLLRFDRETLPPLDSNTYKHRQGHVLIMGGDHGMPGAVAMAAEAALRVGAGMVTVATRQEHATPIIARTPEVMVTDVSRFSGADETGLAERVDLIAIGPGLGRSAWGEALFEQAVGLAERRTLPLLIDADGLYWLSQRTVPRVPIFVTPHVAEAARLLGVEAADVQNDRLHAVDQLRDKFNACGVLKGAGSVLFDTHGTAICAHGNPGMATAGMGDVLSGMAAGLTVQSVADSQLLFRAAVLLHSAAADAAANIVGQRSLLATDVIAHIYPLLRSTHDATD